MTMYKGDENASSELSRQQMSIVTQLFHVVSSIHSVDELFQWLASTMVQSFNIQLIQCWVNSATRTGELTPRLRAMVHQNSSMPELIVVNDQVLSIVQRLLSEQRDFRPQSVATLFSQYQAIMLRRHGLNYCTGCFLSANFLLPLQNTVQAQDGIPTPFAMTILLFMRQNPHLDLASTVASILEQAVSLAGNRGLLLPPPQNTYSTFTPVPNTFTPFPAQPSPSSQTFPPLAELIPRRQQDANLLLTDNPFASKAVIADKRARRFYAAIDGHTKIATLCSTTGIPLQEVFTVLKLLLDQKRIELYEPGEKLIDASFFLNNN